MEITSRRQFLKSLPIAITGSSLLGSQMEANKIKSVIVTVTGSISPDAMGKTLIHEHILVDFIGAKYSTPDRWDREVVIKKVLPYLKVLKAEGCSTLVDCTPNHLGRDPLLLSSLSELSGLNILTNTGYYGGSDEKFLPEVVFTSSAESLAAKWVSEWKNGIDSTSVKPGFIKISVNPDHLSEISQKLVQAAAITHLQTGLTIASHTGPAISAMEEIEIIKSLGVHPSAFIWVHAQNESDQKFYVKACKEGAWVSFDGLNDDNVGDYVKSLSFMKKEKCLDKTLISHDAGWYEPGKENGGVIRNYTTLFRKLIPALRKVNFEDRDVKQLIEINPKNAFSIKIRK